MEQTLKITSISLKDKEERRLVRGHLWVYRNELQSDPSVDDGAVVDVFSAARRFIGRGFYQAQGGIAVRLLSRRQEDIDKGFFVEALGRALGLRERLYAGSSVYRWVFGESDGLPGLVVDRYGDMVVAQTQCAFYGVHSKALAKAILATEGVEGVVIEAPGLSGGRDTFGNCADDTEIELDGLRLRVPLAGGQKTGMFLDQRRNAAAAAALAPGLRVLDAHANTGQWALRMALAGAAQVHAVDTSRAALDVATANAGLNGVADRCAFECAPAEEVLARKEPYGLIVLDPPAYAKARPQTAKALARYQALNRAALAALEPGGYLVTCSCSHFVSQSDFLEMVKRAAIAEQRVLQLLELRAAAPDHPVLLAMPETSYLKCAIFRVW